MPEGCGELAFGAAVAVGVRGVEKRDAVIVVRAPQHRTGEIHADDSPRARTPLINQRLAAGSQDISSNVLNA